MYKLANLNLGYVCITMLMLLLSGCSSSSSTGVATVNVSNSSGTPFSQTVATPINTPLSILLTGEKVASFNVKSQPTNGILTGELSGKSPSMTYSPNLDYVGTDVIQVDVIDIDGYASIGTLNIQVLDTVLPTTDTDGDGLVDLEEINITHTNPKLADTDGDGFSDFEELVTHGFDATVNNYRFNPLIADTPEIDVRIISTPDVRINYTLTDGTSSTVSTTRSQTSSQSVSTSVSESESTSLEESHTVSAEISTSLSTSVEAGLFEPPTAKVEGTVTATAGYSYETTTTQEHSTSWTQEQTQENSTTFEESNSFESNNSIAASDGEISVAVNVTNNGHISFTLNNLYLSSTYIRPRGVNPLVPVGNLSFDTAQGAFPATTLAPGQSTGSLVFRGKGVNLEKIKEILSNSRGFSVRPTLYNMLDENGVAYNFSSTGITSNDVMVIIDYNGNKGLTNVRKMVAVNGIEGKKATMQDVLNQILQVRMTTATDASANTYVDSVNGLSNSDPYANWLIIHGKQEGNNQVQTTIYTTPADKLRWESRNPNVKNLIANYDPASIVLGGGDILHVVYLQDSDLDGLSNRMEYYYRSDPNNPDTDFDQLKDGVEVKDGWDIVYVDEFGVDVYTHVYSNPILADTDGDSVDDYAEVNFSGASHLYSRNPTKLDTDGDGLDDAIDDRVTLTGALLANEYDDLRVSGLKSSVNFASAAVVAGRTVYDVYVEYNLPAILSNPNSQGITDYQVFTLRYTDVTGTGIFPDLINPLQDGQIYIKGDTLPCNTSGTCLWTVVDVSPVNPLPGAYAFTETSGLTVDNRIRAEDIVNGVPADVYKYIQFVKVNGHYTKQQVSSQVSPQTETIEIHMTSGSFYNVRTVFSTTTTQANYNAARTKLFSWLNGGGPVYFDFLYGQTATHGAFRAWDSRNGGIGTLIGDYSMPYSLMRPGDGTLDIAWYLFVDSNNLNNPGRFPISGSYAATWDGGNKAYLPAVIDKNGAFNLDMFVEGRAVGSPAPTLDANGNAVFTIIVPAVAGTHHVELFVDEFDSVRGQYNNFAYPPLSLFPGSGRNKDGHDYLLLTRDATGVWTASTVKSNVNQPTVGNFISGANITRKGNVTPIRYVTHAVQMSDDIIPGSTTIQATFQAQYDIYIK